MAYPKVSVICLCYNQAAFVAEAIDSVLRQRWPAVELIIVDDASSDNSVSVIRSSIANHPEVTFLTLEDNVGSCAAFNRGFARSSGEFIIDLAADDVLLPERIEKGVADLTRAGERYGVTFSDCMMISEDGRELGKHSGRFPHETIPTGDIYTDVISRYFICSPTVMFRRKVMEHLGGYDETLSYEDFDFWVRSSRTFYYSYVPEVLVKKRLVSNSLSEKQFRLFSPHQRSTLKVAEKILELNRTDDERRAFQKRLAYELRTSIRQLNFRTAWGFIRLMSEKGKEGVRD